MKPITREVDVARPVVANLREHGWDVHTEVAIGGGGSARADIVARLGDGPTALLHVIEVKQTFGLDVIAQALHWRGLAHYVSVAVPSPKRADGRARWLAERLCRSEGLGIIHVRPLASWEVETDASPCRVDVAVPPTFVRSRFHAAAAKRLRDVLGDETRTWAEAGNATQEYFTPYRRTCRNIVAALAGGPLTTRELAARAEHHYKSERGAVGALHQWLGLGKVPGVERVPGSEPHAWRLST